MKEKLLSLGLSKDLVEKVEQLYEKAVPYERFQEVINKKNEFQQQNEDLKLQINSRDNQLKELSKDIKNNENLNNEELNNKIKELQELNKKQLEDYNLKLEQYKIDTEIELALSTKGALNNKAARALLDMSIIKFDGEKLVGLNEQLDNIKKDNAFLFKSEKTVETVPQGFVLKDSNGSIAPSLNTMTYNELVNYYENKKE